MKVYLKIFKNMERTKDLIDLIGKSFNVEVKSKW